MKMLLTLPRVSLFVVVALAATMLASLPAAYAGLNDLKTRPIGRRGEMLRACFCHRLHSNRLIRSC